MEKISCDIILDLLPLYCDNVCSPDSRRLVLSHLMSCPDCSKTLKQMQMQCRLPSMEEQNHEAIVRDLAAAWNKTIKWNFLRGVLITLCICALLAGSYWSLTRFFLVSVPAEKLEISVDAVTDQSVTISVKTTDQKSISQSLSHVTEDGKCYLVMKRGVIARENGGGSTWESTETISRTGTLESGEKIPITEIYYGTEHEHVLIWRAGDGI